MDKSPHTESQIGWVTSFDDLAASPLQGSINALCWRRDLEGDFSEIVKAFDLVDNMRVLEIDAIRELRLSEQGQIAKERILNDYALLKAHGASPILNLIKCYERDDAFPYFPTDVYSYHVDRSPVPTDTYLCTYHGDASEILPNAQAEQKILIPEIRQELRKLYDGAEEGFDSFLSEYFFDLHYQARPEAQPIGLGIGSLWKLAVDHPDSQVLPCVHRAPKEESGETRLMIIC